MLSALASQAQDFPPLTDSKVRSGMDLAKFVHVLRARLGVMWATRNSALALFAAACRQCCPRAFSEPALVSFFSVVLLWQHAAAMAVFVAVAAVIPATALGALPTLSQYRLLLGLAGGLAASLAQLLAINGLQA